MKKKIGLLFWFCVVMFGCSKQEVAEFALIKDPSGLGFTEVGKNTYQFLIDDNITRFEDLLRYKISNPSFKDEFIASENAKFPFDETYKNKILEAFNVIFKNDSTKVVYTTIFNKPKKLTRVANYNIETKEAKSFEVSDIPASYENIALVNIEFYARENSNIIDGILYTLSDVVHNYDDKQLYAKTQVRYLDIEYDEHSRIKTLRDGIDTFEFNYHDEDVFEVTKKNADSELMLKFDSKALQYTIDDTTGSYHRIEPNKQYFTETETPYGMFYYNGILHSYDEQGRLKFFANCTYDTPCKGLLYGFDWNYIYSAEY